MSRLLIREAQFPTDAPVLAGLFREYVEWLGIDLQFQGFQAELASLPGKYARPAGCALLAEYPTASTVGCVAMRPLQPEICEMKRLYLRTEARGTGLGRALAEALIEEARRAGYQRMVLDTLDHMDDALRLYKRLGFSEIAPYYHNPIRGVVYLGLKLD